jgi:hypothetical protein
MIYYIIVAALLPLFACGGYIFALIRYHKKYESTIQPLADTLKNDIQYCNKLIKINKELNEDLAESIRFYYSQEH